MSLFRRGSVTKRISFAATALVIATSLAASAAFGDTLELKSGRVIEGKFLDGSPLNIRFQVNGKIETFATKDVLNIGFDDSGSHSMAAPAPAAPSQAAPPAETHAAATAATTPPAANSANRMPASSSAAAAPATPSPQTNRPDMRSITIPAGTSLLVRMIDSVDSSTNKVGDPFKASLEGPLVVGDTVVAAKGADVYGKLAQAKTSGKFAGAAQLTLELTGIRISGQIVPIDSSDYDVAGKSRGKQSAERIGGGAVLGAVIGAIAGGGKGAAVGAAVGGGAGTAAQVLTHGPKVRIPSETLLEFKLQQSATAQIPD